MLSTSSPLRLTLLSIPHNFSSFPRRFVSSVSIAGGVRTAAVEGSYLLILTLDSRLLIWRDQGFSPFRPPSTPPLALYPPPVFSLDISPLLQNGTSVTFVKPVPEAYGSPRVGLSDGSYWDYNRGARAWVRG